MARWRDVEGLLRQRTCKHRCCGWSSSSCAGQRELQQPCMPCVTETTLLLIDAPLPNHIKSQDPTPRSFKNSSRHALCTIRWAQWQTSKQQEQLQRHLDSKHLGSFLGALYGLSVCWQVCLSRDTRHSRWKPTQMKSTQHLAFGPSTG